MTVSTTTVATSVYARRQIRCPPSDFLKDRDDRRPRGSRAQTSGAGAGTPASATCSASASSFALPRLVASASSLTAPGSVRSWTSYGFEIPATSLVGGSNELLVGIALSDNRMMPVCGCDHDGAFELIQHLPHHEKGEKMKKSTSSSINGALGRRFRRTPRGTQPAAGVELGWFVSKTRSFSRIRRDGRYGGCV